MLLRSLNKLLLLSVAFCFSAPVRAQINTTLITNCLEVLKLSPEQAAENRPVRVRGVVTCYVPGSQLCFVQDESAGIYVQPAPWPKELHAGQVVDVEGTTAQGRFSPIIQMGVIRPTTEKTTLSPRRISVEELNTGRFDCQYVEIEGVVQRLEIAGNVVDMRIVAGGAALTALIFSVENAPTNLLDARVRTRGIAGTFYAGNQLTGFGLFLQDASFLELVRPPDVPFSQPIRRLDSLAWYSPEGAMDHRIQVRGTVTLAWPGDAFFIRDETSTLRVTPGNPNQMPAAGDVVDVIGFLRNPTSPNPMLLNASWRKIDHAEVAMPRATPLAQHSGAAAKGQLVSIEGTMVALSSSNNVSVMVLEDDGHTIRAYARQPVAQKLVNSSVRVSGVLSPPPGKFDSTETSLLVGATNAFTVLRAPAVAIAPGSSNLLTAASVVAALILAAFAWVAFKNSRQVEALAQANATRLKETEKEFEQLKETRERLGRDLHDHIIQSIYAVGLSLEDCRHSLMDPHRIDSRIKSALAEINDVIRELRNVILGLESNTIQPREFRTALKSVALTLGQDSFNRIRLDLDQAALDGLSPAQATELIHIAREAMSNSVRHGGAQTTTVSLAPHQDWLRFVVEDDGKGFNPQKIDSTGYGLRNMAKRAEDLGAKFTISAQEGLGTRIVLDIPKQKQHFSNSEPRSRIDR